MGVKGLTQISSAMASTLVSWILCLRIRQGTVIVSCAWHPSNSAILRKQCTHNNILVLCSEILHVGDDLSIPLDPVSDTCQYPNR